MKYIIALMGFIFVMGCQTTSVDKTPEMIEKRYSKIHIDDGVTEKEAVIWAQHTILKDNLRGDYDILKPWVDNKLMMPEAYRFVFIQFPPTPQKAQSDSSPYLIVINRFYQRIEYRGAFKAPAGDPVYRYLDILRSLGVR